MEKEPIKCYKCQCEIKDTDEIYCGNCAGNPEMSAMDMKKALLRIAGHQCDTYQSQTNKHELTIIYNLVLKLTKETNK